MGFTRRPIRADEYAELRARAGYHDTAEPRPYRLRPEYVLFALCVGFASLLIPVIVIKKAGDDLALLWGGLTIVLLLAFLKFFHGMAQRHVPSEDPKRRERYAADLEAREVDEWRLHVIDAADVETDEDVGRYFYLELADEGVLFVSEDDVLNAEYDQGGDLRFPRRDVILTKLPHADEILGIEGVGEDLYLSATLPDFPPEDYEKGRVPASGTFLPGDLSSCAQRHTDDYDD